MKKKPEIFKILSLVAIVLSVPVAVILVQKAVSFFTGAAGTNADLVVDVGSSYESRVDVWRHFAQGGEEKGRMLAPVVERMKSLYPEYVRIDHVFDAYGVVSGTPGNLSLDWARLDQTIDDIRAMGANPFISFSYMPPQISKSGNPEDFPVNWADWELIVQRTVEHLSSKYAGVYYEVWNEPDLFGNFKVYGKKNYLDMYVHTAAGVARAKGVKPYKLGGPATTGLYENWFRAMMELRNRGTRVDFISWHRYSKNIEDFERDVVNVNNWGADYPGFEEVELIISELGPNSENDKIYDQSFAGIHAIAVASVLEGEVDKGFSFEIKDGPGPEKYWGRWGMFTHEKFGGSEAKPRAAAFAYLNRMLGGSRLNVAGEGSWVKAFARQNAGQVRLLVVNYDPRGKHTEAVPIKFVNLQSQSFSFKRSSYGGDVKQQDVATTSAEWATLEIFEPNTSAIFELTPR